MSEKKSKWVDPEKNRLLRTILRLHFFWLAALLPLTLWNAATHQILPHFHSGFGRMAFFAFFYLSAVVLIFFLFYLEAWAYPETTLAALLYSGGVLVNAALALLESKGQIFYAANVSLVLLLAAQTLSFGFLAGIAILSRTFFFAKIAEEEKTSAAARFFLGWRSASPKLVIFFLVVFGVSGFFGVLFVSPILATLGSIHWALALVTVLLFTQQIVFKMRPFFTFIVRGYAENDMTMNLNWTFEIIFGIILSVLYALPIMGGALSK